MEVTPYLADTGNGIEWNGYLEGPDNRTTTRPHNNEGWDPEIEEEERMVGGGEGEGGIHIEWGLVWHVWRAVVCTVLQSKSVNFKKSSLRAS